MCGRKERKRDDLKVRVRAKRGACFTAPLYLQYTVLLPQIFLNWGKHQLYQDSQKLLQEFKVTHKISVAEFPFLDPIRFLSLSSSEIHVPTSCLTQQILNISFI